MFGVPLCDRRLLQEHAATHARFVKSPPKEPAVPGDACLPPAAAAIDAWFFLEEYVRGVLGADEKFHRKREVFAVVSPTLELIAEHERAKAEMDSVSAMLAAE